MEFSAIMNAILGYYDVFGRQMLDFLHIVFDNIFYAFLFIAIIVSVLYYLVSVYVLFNKNRAKEKRFITEKAPFVTVQIPTYNELAAIRCAKKCLEFDYPKDRYEIIIGDDSNKTDVSRKLDGFAKKHELIRITRRGSNIGYKAGNLNHMLKYSKGSILVLFDSDFVPPRDFLKRIVTPFIYDKELAGVQARWKFINANQNMVSILGASIVAICHHVLYPFFKNRRGISFLCGSAEAVRKDLLVKLGGWKNGSLTEDIEYALRLLKNGYRIEYLEKLECGSEVPYTPKDLYRQQMRWAFGVIDALKEHGKDIIRNKKLSIRDKFFINFACSGYLFAVLLLFLFITGFLSFITHKPEPIDLLRFFSELGRNIALTSGILMAGVVAQAKSKNIKGILTSFISCFSYGLVVTYYVNIGIFKVLTKRPMEWFMLNKNGNKTAA